MTKPHAIQHAKQAAKLRRQFVYIVWSVEDQDRPREHYHLASEFDLSTFYQGCTVVCRGAT